MQIECPTRWSSICVMLQRLIHARVPLAAALAKLSVNKDNPPRNLTEEEWDLLIQFERILSPIQKATELLQHQEFPTIGIVFPIINRLLNNHLDSTVRLEHRQAEARQMGLDLPPPSPLEHFKILVGDHISKEFFALIGGWEKELTLSVFLDPRVKDFFFIEDTPEEPTVGVRQALCGHRNDMSSSEDTTE